MTTEPATDSIPEISNPTGRDEVRAAVLRHAADLFAERGPAATSVRDIAERAGVNHGLVFRHFGAKENLVAAVLDHLGDEHGAADFTGLDSGATPAAYRRHLTVIARCLLDGYPVGQMQQRFPVMTALVDHIRATGADDRTAALTAAHTTALVIGWELFAPFLRAATGLQDIPESELRQDIAARAVDILHSANRPAQ
ncbi:TetR/AcrR family transcriptional regulator [Nocardia tengchongensis]